MNTTFNNNIITLRKNMNCDYALGSACGFRRLLLMLSDETICFMIMVVKSTSQNIDKNNITVKIVLTTGLPIELIRRINTFDMVYCGLLPITEFQELEVKTHWTPNGVVANPQLKSVTVS